MRKGKIHTNTIQKSMKKPTLEEILKVASFDYDEEGKLILTRLDADLVGDHFGYHEGDHFGDHITPKPEKTTQNEKSN